MIQSHRDSAEILPVHFENLEPRLLLSVSANAWDMTASSYLGGTGSDEVRGAVIQDDGTIVLAANIGNATPGGLTPTLLNGATASSSGALIRLSSDGTTVLSVTRLSDKVLDLSEDSAGNLYVAMYDDGFAKVNADASSVLWSKTTLDLGFNNVQRIDAGPTGYVAVLGGGGLDNGSTLGDDVRIFDPTGLELGGNSGGKWKNDVAIDEASQTVIYLGYRNAYDSASGLPVQVSYYRGIAYDGTVKYTGYDYSTNENDPNYLNSPDNNMADTRGYRAEIGDDGYLYLAFESAGGNNIFNSNPFDVDTPVSLTGADQWHQAYNTGANHITYFGRYVAATGDYVLGTHFVPRLSSTEGNTAFIRRGNITADANGQVFVGGTTAWGLPLDTHPANPSGTSFNPGLNNNYLGGGYLLVMNSTMTSREYTTRTSDSWTYAIDTRPLPGGGSQVVFGGLSNNQVYVDNAIQSTNGGGVDGWFSVIADSAADPANTAPVAQITAVKTGGTVGTVELALSASSSFDADLDPLRYLWNFGDDEQAEGINVTHEFSLFNKQTITLTVLDDSTGWSTDTLVIGPPSAEFTMDDFTGQAPFLVTFDASGTTSDNDPSLISYYWDFGDGNTAYGINTYNIYNQPGIYTVKMTATDPLGATDTVEQTVVVTDPNALWSKQLDFERPADGARPVDKTRQGWTRAFMEEYHAQTGFGYETVNPNWNTYGPPSYGSYSSDSAWMNEDGHDSTVAYQTEAPATYLVDVPNGFYEVIIHSQSDKYTETFLGISLEGQEVDSYWTVDEYSRESRAYYTYVSDGQLTIDLAADYDLGGGWRWSGLEVHQLSTMNDQAPTLGGTPAAPMAYADGSGPQTLAPNLTLTDDGTSPISGATVKINAGLLSSQDLLAATTVGNITASYNAITGVLTLSGVDSATNYQTVLRSVTYASTAATSDGDLREITFQVTDAATSSNLAVVYVSPESAGTMLLVDNFESYTAGDLLDGSGDWTAENGADIVADPADPANLVGHVWDRTTDASNNNTNLLIADGAKGTLFFRVRVGDPGEGVNLGLAEAGTDSVSAGLNIQKQEVEMGRVGGSVTSKPTNEVWYRVWVEVDNDANTQKVYIQSDEDPNYATRKSIGSGPLASGTGDLAEFVAKFANHPDALHTYLDDIYMFAGGVIAPIDLPTVSVVATDFLAAENATSDTAQWTFSRVGDTTNPLTIHYSINSDALPSDYNTDVALNGSVTIPAGSTFASITLTGIDDDLVEGTEYIELILTPDATYNTGDQYAAAVGIVDDEPVPTVTVTASDSAAGEAGQDPGTFTFTRTGPTTYDLDVIYTVSGRADASDYSPSTPLTGTITISAGQASTSVIITPIDDGDIEGYEDIRITLNDLGPEYVAAAPGDTVLPIIDDEMPIDYILLDDFDSYPIDEPIDRQPNWESSDGNALVTADPLDANNQVVASLDRAQDLVFKHPDIRVSDGQLVTLFHRLYFDDIDSDFARLGLHVGVQEYDITAGADAETPGLAGAPMTPGIWYNIWQVVDHATNTVNVYAQSPDDPAYIEQQLIGANLPFSSSGTWSDPAGLWSFNVMHDNKPDTTSMRFDDIHWAAGDARLINPVDPGTVDVSVFATDNQASEDGTDPGEFTFVRSGDVTNPLTVFYTVGGSTSSGEYSATPLLAGSITIPAGSVTATVQITGIDDDLVEGLEDLNVTLTPDASYTVGSQSFAHIDIIDNDQAATVTVSPSDVDAGEAGPNPGEFTFTRTGPTTYPLEVAYTVSGRADASDYNSSEPLTGLITIPAGQSSVSVTITPINDSEVEGYEDIRITLDDSSPQYVAGDTGDAVLPIIDDEKPIDYLLLDDFESYADGDKINTKTYWTSSDGSAYVYVDPSDAGNLALQSVNRNEDVIFKHPDIRVADGQTTTLFYRLYANSMTSEEVEIGLHDGVKQNGLAADGNLDNGQMEGDTIQTGFWYNVWQVTNHATNTVDIYMQSNDDPAFQTQQQVVAGKSFATNNWSDPQTLWSFNIQHKNHPNTTSVRVDDIYWAAGDTSAVSPIEDAVSPTVLAVTREPDITARPDQLNALNIQFSEDVAGTVDITDFTLTNTSAGVPVDISGQPFSYDVQTATASIDLSSLALGAANYELTVTASGITDQSGNALDGDGNGTGGDDYVESIYVAIPGDANSDGTVNIGDLTLLAGSFGQNGDWADGDFNDDGLINIGDLTLLAGNFGTSAAAESLAQTTEPSASATDDATNYNVLAAWYEQSNNSGSNDLLGLWEDAGSESVEELLV